MTAYGRRDVAAGLPVESDTLWRIYSMTKPVTVVAALLLVEEAGCRWTIRSAVTCRRSPRRGCTRAAPVPGCARVPRPALLVRHLMTHTAGLTFAFYHAHPVDALYREAGLDSSVAPGADLAGRSMCTPVCRCSSIRGRSGTTRSPPTCWADRRGGVRAAARRLLRRADLRPAGDGGRRFPGR
ncbi:serine hydrolase [Streptomyces sp. INA 01156]